MNVQSSAAKQVSKIIAKLARNKRDIPMYCCKCIIASSTYIYTLHIVNIVNTCK